ncbi:MAG: type II toxin-antitoxin system RelE/ParE family toxin [Candidatus Bathyarchaeia archaeon]
MKFKVLLHKRAYDFLGSLSLEDRHRIIDRIRGLENFPKVRLDIVKVAGEKDTFRLRVGDYRALFRVYEREKIIVIVKIDLRRRVYR